MSIESFFPLKTPVLFILFSRLETTKKVFSVIKQVRPARLYLASDAPRLNKHEECKEVEGVRAYILKNIDWDCQVKTRFQEKNTGPKYAVSAAVTWFFENESEGIILENDCVPNLSFFVFCQILLERYRDNQEIWHIGGNNFQSGFKYCDGDYYYSRYSYIWGWATWADRWRFYNVELAHINEVTFLDKIHTKVEVCRYWHDIYDRLKAKKLNTWDYQWLFTIWIHLGKSIVPHVNLVSNIGFLPDAVHTKIPSSGISSLPVTAISPPFLAPSVNAFCDEADRVSNYVSEVFLKKNHVRLYNYVFRFFRERLDVVIMVLDNKDDFLKILYKIEEIIAMYPERKITFLINPELKPFVLENWKWLEIDFQCVFSNLVFVNNMLWLFYSIRYSQISGKVLFYSKISKETCAPIFNALNIPVKKEIS
jgi:hypothetical protein